MANLKYIIGDFATGVTSELNVLPVIHGSDSVQVDVNSGDNLTLSISKRDIPEDWKTFLKVVDTTISLIDSDLAWDAPGAVLFSGFVNKISASIGETISVQVAGYREYGAIQKAVNVFNATSATPSTSATFEAGTYQGLISKVLGTIFNNPNIPVNSPKFPPNILGSLSGESTGTTVSYSALASAFMSYADIADEVRDVLSTYGNEYRFVPRWSDSNKNKIVVDILVASDSQAHIKENEVIEIVLNDNTNFKHSKFGMDLSSAGMANRLIAQSKAGDSETDDGADLTTLISTGGASVLLDSTFNPGVELTEAQMSEQLTARLTTMLNAQGTAQYIVQEADKSYWLNSLGKTIHFTGAAGTESEGYDITVRITDLTFSASNNTIPVGVLVPQPRYPRLPRARNNQNDNGGTGYGGSGGSGYYGAPMAPAKLPNMPKPVSGGGGGVVTPPSTGTGTPIAPQLQSPNEGLTFTDGYLNLSGLEPWSGSSATQNGNMVILPDFGTQAFINDAEFSQIGNPCNDVVIKNFIFNDEMDALISINPNFNVFPASLIESNRKVFPEAIVIAAETVVDSISNRLYYNPFQEKLYIFFLQTMTFNSNTYPYNRGNLFHSWAYTINMSTDGTFSGNWKEMFRLGDDGALDSTIHYLPNRSSGTFGGETGKAIVFMGCEKFVNFIATQFTPEVSGDYQSIDAFWLNGDIANAGEKTSGVYWKTITPVPVGKDEVSSYTQYEITNASYIEGKIYASNNATNMAGGQDWKPTQWVANATKDLNSGLTWAKIKEEATTDVAYGDNRKPFKVFDSLIWFYQTSYNFIRLAGNSSVKKVSATYSPSIPKTTYTDSTFTTGRYIIYYLTNRGVVKNVEKDNFSSLGVENLQEWSSPYQWGNNIFFFADSAQSNYLHFKKVNKI